MPIQVIVVLFVALAVGGAIIAFSQSSLNSAKDTLNEQWKNDPANKDTVVEVAQVTDKTLLTLAQECVRENAGSVEEKLCFALFSEDFTMANWAGVNNTAVGQGFNISIQVKNNLPAAVRLTYNPITNHIDVT